jgi:hypothetical protein
MRHVQPLDRSSMRMHPQRVDKGPSSRRSVRQSSAFIFRHWFSRDPLPLTTIPSGNPPAHVLAITSSWAVMTAFKEMGDVQPLDQAVLWVLQEPVDQGVSDLPHVYAVSDHALSNLVKNFQSGGEHRMFHHRPPPHW